MHSTTFGTNQLAMVAGSGHAGQAFDDEDIVERARRTGEAFKTALAPLVERYEMFHEVRGKGLMIGLVVRRRRSPRPCGGGGTRSSACGTALFSQLVVVPLFHRHGSSPRSRPTTSTSSSSCRRSSAEQEEVDYFVDALDDVLTAAGNGSGLFWEVGRTMVKGALRRSPG